MCRCPNILFPLPGNSWLPPRGRDAGKAMRGGQWGGWQQIYFQLISDQVEPTLDILEASNKCRYFQLFPSDAISKVRETGGRQQQARQESTEELEVGKSPSPITIILIIINIIIIITIILIIDTIITSQCIAMESWRWENLVGIHIFPVYLLVWSSLITTIITITIITKSPSPSLRSSSSPNHRHHHHHPFQVWEQCANRSVPGSDCRGWFQRGWLEKIGSRDDHCW